LSTITKAKINLKEGIIELEGSEIFVTKQLEIFSQKIQNLNVSKLSKPDNGNEPDSDNLQSALSDDKKRRRKNATPRIVQPIALDLKQTEKRPSLKDFYKLKNPKTDMERTAVFAYYLK
jgi:hypothetical protein